MKKVIDFVTVKFLIVGVINTLVGATVMFVAYNFFHLNYWISSAANYIVGSVVSFFLNKYFTFQNSDRSFMVVVRFVLNIVVCYLIAYGIARPLMRALLQNTTLSIQENVAMLAGMCIFTVLNYLGQRYFAFKS